MTQDGGFKQVFAATPVSRRAMLGALPALAVSARSALGRRQSNPPLRVERLHSFGLAVEDVERSVDFYQGLFGMAVQAREGSSVSLRIGDGPQYVSFRQLEDGESPSITHMGYTTANFDAERTMAALNRSGFERIDAPPVGRQGVDTAMKGWIRTGGGRPELFFADANGLVVQLQDPSDCGGGGPRGSACTPEEVSSEGLLRLRDLSHFTVFTGGRETANMFYQDLFGFGIQAYQGPNAPVLGVGDGIQFVMFAGGGNTPTNARIHHACMNMDDFHVEVVQAALERHGIQPRGDAGGGTPRLVHYISLRMPNRGGAEGGTPELYFTDPDGLLMQLQDSSYCGGGGILGNECG